MKRIEKEKIAIKTQYAHYFMWRRKQKQRTSVSFKKNLVLIFIAIHFILARFVQFLCDTRLHFGFSYL